MAPYAPGIALCCAGIPPLTHIVGEGQAMPLIRSTRAAVAQQLKVQYTRPELPDSLTPCGELGTGRGYKVCGWREGRHNPPDYGQPHHKG